MKQMKCKIIIKLQRHLNGKWKECFEGMEISYEGNNTILTGNLKDEAHMHGVLNILRDYNLILISFNSVKDNLMSRVKLCFKPKIMNTTKMKAVVCTKYGPPEVLQLKEVGKPTPKNDEVCIKIHASAVTSSDIFIRGSQIPIQFWIPMRLMIGLIKPRKSIIGLVLAGEIESTGKNIKRFKTGDHVYGLTGFGLGAYAEYKCMQETDSLHGCLAIKPNNISYEEATVAAYGGLLAFQYMGKGNIQGGHKVLIYGASGTTGTIAIQLAKYLGAKVTGVCSTTNLELVKSLGANAVIDYTKEDTLNPGVQYDFILDAVGKFKTSKLKDACKKALAPIGKYVSIDDGKLMLDSNRLALVKELVEAGHIKPVIDRTYPLEQIAEAHTYVGKGHKKGGVGITVCHNGK